MGRQLLARVVAMIAWHATMAQQRAAGRTVASIAAEWGYGLRHVVRVLRQQGMPPAQNPRRIPDAAALRAKQLRAAGAKWPQVAEAVGCSIGGARGLVRR